MGVCGDTFSSVLVPSWQISYDETSKLPFIRNQAEFFTSSLPFVQNRAEFRTSSSRFVRNRADFLTSSLPFVQAGRAFSKRGRFVLGGPYPCKGVFRIGQKSH